MTPLSEFIFRNTDIQLGKITFDLDESLDTNISMITENNRVVWTNSNNERILMSPHSEDRLERSVEDGGDGGSIDRSEIIDMIEYAWPAIKKQWEDGYIRYYMTKIYTKGKLKYGSSRFVMWCDCYLKRSNEGELTDEERKRGGKVVYDGARPDNKTLWIAFSANNTQGNLDLSVITLFRGKELYHQKKYERIHITKNGQVELLPSEEVYKNTELS